MYVASKCVILSIPLGDEPFTDETAVRQELIQQCVELLLRGGASGSAADNLGLQPLHYAAQTHCELQRDR